MIIEIARKRVKEKKQRRTQDRRMRGNHFAGAQQDDGGGGRCRGNQVLRACLRFDLERFGAQTAATCDKTNVNKLKKRQQKAGENDPNESTCTHTCAQQ
jgi:hypothetical protein